MPSDSAADPESYYGLGFIERLRKARLGGATTEELIDLVCVADITPIVSDARSHLPSYVELLTASPSEVERKAQAAVVYDKFNDRLIGEALEGSLLSGDEDALRVLRIAFAINSHGALIECVKGEDPAVVLSVSRLMRAALLALLVQRPVGERESQ